MLWMDECLFCHSFAYALSDGRVKCSKCLKKISLEKINKLMLLIYVFVDNESAWSLSQRTKLSYSSVQKYFHHFRILCAKICENEYEYVRMQQCEYEEYYYLEHSKKHKKEAIFDAHNFLTFDYSQHIYTVLMPSLQQYKKQFLEDNVAGGFMNEFNSFKRKTRIIKVEKHFNNIVTFWEYFERSILKYKGIKNSSFIYFLKECEFKYNHTKEEAIELLLKHYLKDDK